MKINNQTIQVMNRLSRDDRGVFFLQLLAALKLEQHPETNGDFSFSALLQENVSVFKIYGFLNTLADQNAAFQVDEKTLESLSSGELVEIVKAVREINLASIDYDFVSKLAQASAFNRHTGEYVLPSEICELMVKLAGIEKKTSVICPFNNPEWLAFKAAETSDDVTIYDEKDSPLPHLLNILLDKQVKVRLDDDPREIYSQKFDVFLAKPSFRPSDNNEEIRQIAEFASKRAVILVPNGFLFRTVAEEFQLKKEMFIEKAVEAVIALPAGMLQNTSLPVSLLVLDRSTETEKILFVNASGDADGAAPHKNRKIETDKIIKIVAEKAQGENSVLVSSDAVRENEFNLSPERYLLQVREGDIFTFLETSKTTQLGELVELYRPQSIRDFQVYNAGEKFFEVSVSDIGENGYVSNPAKEINLIEPFSNRFDNLILQPDDILLPIKGSVGKVGLVPETVGNWIANQSLIIIRLKKKSLINSVVLFSYLASEIGQTLLQTYTSGATIPFIQMRDVRQLKIPIPTAEVQNEIVARFEKIQQKFAEIEKLKKQTLKLRQEIRNIFVHQG